MPKTRNGWICDTCKQPILKVEDGWLEWLNVHVYDNGHDRETGLRLVHHRPASPLRAEGGCQYKSQLEYRRRKAIVAHMSLQECLGPEGLIQLTELLSQGFEPAEEVLEMIKRLHVPGYEHARLHFKEAIAGGVFEPNRKPGYYWLDNINATLEWMDTRGY